MAAQRRCLPGYCIPDLKRRRRWQKRVLYKCRICGQWFTWRPPNLKIKRPNAGEEEGKN